MKALIDGDGIAYRAAAAVEKTKYLVEIPPGPEDIVPLLLYPHTWKEARELEGGTIWSRREIGTLDEARVVCDSFMRRIRENTSDDYSLFLTPSSGNFRDNLATHTKYKANRDGASRPVYLADIREYLRDSYSGRLANGCEAEDEVSIQAKSLGQDNYIVVGNDKDLLQIPGHHYNWVDNESFNVSPHESRDALWMQTIMGDRTDNIPGCWRMGFQKAKNRITVWNTGHESATTDFMLDMVVLPEYLKSKKYKDCPYAEESEEATYRRVYETYWLVKLKEYSDEIVWYPKIKNKKNLSETNGTTKAKEDTNMSESVPGASGTGQFTSEKTSGGQSAIPAAV